MDDETAMLIARKTWCSNLGYNGAAWPGEKGLDGFAAGYKAGYQASEEEFHAPLGAEPQPHAHKGRAGTINATEAEALALVRELNDALVIPGWLQPRVDALLDRAEPEIDTRTQREKNQPAIDLIGQWQQQAIATDAVIEAARAYVETFNYVRGMPDTDPHKGHGNRLADALAALDTMLLQDAKS